jgi:S1-C subfamily serine protease
MNRARTVLLGFAGGLVGAALLILILAVLSVGPFGNEKKDTVATVVGEPVGSTTGGGLTPSQLYQLASPGVVEIVVTLPSGGGEALGSGFVVSSQGYILTNAHVVDVNGQAVKTATVAFRGAGTATTRVKGRVVGFDNTSDVALIKVDPAKAPALRPLPLGNSDAVLVGEPVIAIGNPLGFDFSLTSGIVSATHRDLQSPNGAVIANGIQTDAAINEGNSGGPLIDSSGKVIGINEQIASQSGGSQGLGFAVPINTAVSSLKQLQQKGTVTYAWLGLAGQSVTPNVAQALNLPAQQGVLVAQVVAGSPAAKAGLKAGTKTQTVQGVSFTVGGDMITAVDGKSLASMDQLASLVLRHRPGDQLTLTVVSGSASGKSGGQRQVQVTLGTKPNGP